MRLRFADELKRLGHVVDVLSTELLGACVGLQVILTIGETETALAGGDDRLLIVLWVGSRANGEGRDAGTPIGGGKHAHQVGC